MSIFKDVSENHPYYDAIKYVSDIECMSGTPSGLFDPDGTVYYYELLIYLIDFLGVEQVSAKTVALPDLDELDWAEDYLYTCVANKLCDMDDLSIEKLNEEVDRITLDATFHNAKTAMPYLGVLPRRKLIRRGGLTRGELAQCFYELGQATAQIILKEIERLTGVKEYWECIELEDAYKFGRTFYPSDLATIFDLMDGTCNLDDYVFMRKILQLKKPFFYEKTRSNTIYHYTSLQALEKLTQPEAKFRLSNSAYLNDPEEGKIASSIAKDIVSEFECLSEWPFYKKEGEHVSISNTFVASFMPNCDELTMWAQYGDGGSGCCIGFPSTCFREDLYTVFYEKSVFENFFRRICETLTEYLSKNPEADVEDHPVFMYATTVVKQVIFLYKDPSYSYENEVRILQFRHPKYAQVESFIRNGEHFPRIYKEATFIRDDVRSKRKKLLPCSSIVLGPKVLEAEKIAISLAHRGYSERITTKSKIKFR